MVQFILCRNPDRHIKEKLCVKGTGLYVTDRRWADALPQTAAGKQLSALTMTGTSEEEEQLDFSQVIGQTQAKRALEAAAAGGHHMIYSTAGSRETMLAKSFPQYCLAY